MEKSNKHVQEEIHRIHETIQIYKESKSSQKSKSYRAKMDTLIEKWNDRIKVLKGEYTSNYSLEHDQFTAKLNSLKQLTSP